MKIFGFDGWKEELLKTIDAAVLPVIYGGTRTDPDGNPQCNTIINWAGQVPEHYYLTKNTEKFARKENVKKVVIPRQSKFEVKVEVKQPGLILEWEFEAQCYDIGFQILLEQSNHQNESEITEIIPMNKFETEYEPIKGRIKVQGSRIFVELQKIMKDDVPKDMYEDKYIFYKFLKARNFNLNQAESMMRNHLKWRKEIQIDTIISDFSTTRANKYDVLKCVLQEMEKIYKRLRYQSEKLGRPVNQSIFIYNLENMTLAKATHRQSVELFAEGIQIFQDNYPEFLKKIYIINASVYFTLVFPIVKRILSGAVIDKIDVYGKDGWKDVLLNAIDADVLPAFLGGNRTDPDGNPNCNTFLVHSGMIPESYYLTKDFSQMARRMEPNISLLIDNLNEDVIPVHKVETENKSETGQYRCKTAGTYTVIFDNTYSWFHSKELYYRTWVIDPYDSDFSKEDGVFQIDF
ncbi:SEC14-like protein 2 [Caerostris extrusa]|uniref:SEC14-like protein 2 n=1 Tax=Caerostris extrusa TaxID=172846 RepID=A0AAV4MSG5_CAEEX|nr:SEC14-like protein 2 [Caerostris extrusa]